MQEWVLKLFIYSRKHYFPDVSGGVHGFGVPPTNQRPNAQQQAGGNVFGNQWGRGQALGRD
jgi:Derlin-1